MIDWFSDWIDDEFHNWTKIKSERDIQNLLQVFDGFKESVLVESHYESGDFLIDYDKDVLIEARGRDLAKKLYLFFDSSMCGKHLQLCFEGVKQFHINNWDGFNSSEISNCYLSMHNDLQLPKIIEQHIVWANATGFSPKDMRVANGEMPDFVIALNLKWRIIEKLQ